jgi:hypothetical protein
MYKKMFQVYTELYENILVRKSIIQDRKEKIKMLGKIVTKCIGKNMYGRFIGGHIERRLEGNKKI